MSPRLVFVLAIILAYAGAFFIFKKKFISLFVGIEYLFIGFFLYFLAPVSDGLQPLLFPFLGWIGLLMGLQVKVDYLRGLTADFYIKVFSYAVISSLLIGITLYYLDFHNNAIVAGIALSSISYKSAAFFIPPKRAGNRFVLFFVSFLPFVLIILLFAYYAFSGSYVQLFLMISFIIAFSIILRLVLAIVEQRDAIILVLMGFILFISETCAIVKISPIVVCFFIGIYLTNFSHHKEIIFTTLYKDEKQLYVLFLILLGMVAGIKVTNAMLVEVLLIIIIAALAKFASFKPPLLGFPRLRWYIFLTPGGFSIAIMTDWWLNSGSPKETLWFSSFLVSVVLLQFISIFMGKRKRIKDEK